MEIIPAPVLTNRDLTVMASTLQTRVLLTPTSLPVRCGAPLVPDSGAWRIARPDETPLLFALTFGYGGEQIDAARGIVVDTHVRNLTPGRCRMVDPLAQSTPQFVNDPAGPYIALTRSQVMLG